MNRKTVAVGLATWIAMLGSQSWLFRSDLLTGLLGCVLLLVCVGPGFLWFVHRMPHLPLYEAYAAIHFIYYWQPMGQRLSQLFDLAEPDRHVALLVLCAYLLSGYFVNWCLVQRLRKPHSNRPSVWSSPVIALRDPRFGLGLILFWMAYTVLLYYGWLSMFVSGAAFPYVRAFSSVCGILGILALGMQSGAGTLSKSLQVSYIAILTIGTLLTFASGYLGVGSILIGHAFFAHVAVSRRIPVVAITLTLILVSFLNYGKPGMRQVFWRSNVSTPSLTQTYIVWVRASFDAVFDTRGDRYRGSSIFERANLVGVYARLIRDCPRNIPYYSGETYRQSLQLFIPRIIWPDRPHLHSVMAEIGLRYGFHADARSASLTNISIGQVGEAWINGGWLGVILIGSFFGVFFCVGTWTAYGRPVDSVGFLFGMMFFGSAANVEHLAGTMLMTFYQTALVGVCLLYLLSQRLGTHRATQVARSRG